MRYEITLRSVSMAAAVSWSQPYQSLEHTLRAARYSST